MSEKLLKGGEATTAFQPPASERVPELMGVESPHLAQNPHPSVELPWRRESHELADASLQVLLQIRWQWNPSHLAALRLVHGENAVVEVELPRFRGRFSCTSRDFI
jgi:hypothetical protein